MNKLLGPAAFVLASAALAVSFWGPGRAEAPSPTERPEPVAAAPASLEGVERRIQALEDTTLSLSRRLMELEKRPGGGGGDSGGAPPALAAEVQQLREEVRGLVVGETLGSAGGREALKDAMRSVQDEMRSEQFQARQEEWMQGQARAQAQRAERVKKFVSEAKLSYSQEAELTRRLEAEETSRNTLFEQMRTGSKDPREMRQTLRTQRQETDQAIKSVLDESQQAKYDEMRREEMRGGGGGRPRGPREGGPGGP
ncbi:hypothetical protein LZ198_23545 [Myxococcus sp. K15C18031901]|uniref:hypothetical protein n=1 Tax=Myxococcus dinghuensis TaxID=2906761 RepID=UPI0020A822EC|nr:hypothetical protein [Myxococcus dinghuensis]MCP3101856.1 hypothetical protein [Myxococcus dinghuensis]